MLHRLPSPGLAPYSPAVMAGGFCFVSCQLPVDPANGAIVEGGAGAQAGAALRHVAACLDAFGMTMADVASTTALLARLDDIEAVNGAYRQAFTAGFPARTAYEAGGLPAGVRVAIGAVAWRG